MSKYTLSAHRGFVQALYRLSRDEAGLVTVEMRNLAADPGGLGEIVPGDHGFVMRRYRFGRYRVLYEVDFSAGLVIRLLSLDWDE